MNSDVIFFLLLGAGLWTSLRLCRPDGSSMSLLQLARQAVLEGLVCAMVWFAVTALTSFSLDALLQSTVVGALWAGFTFVAHAALSQQSEQAA